MTKTFMEILDEEEIDLAVGPFASFLIPPGSHDGDRTWSRYAYGYDAAFRELFETAWQAWPRRDYLVEPVIFTGRHALELAMKDAADRLSWHTGELVKFLGHCLANAGRNCLDSYDWPNIQLSTSGPRIVLKSSLSFIPWTRMECGSAIQTIKPTNPS